MPDKDDEFLSLARDRFKLVAKAESNARAESLDDLQFSIGEQWPQNIQSQRRIDGRPCLTMNRLPQFIRQITNEQRQQRPSIQINPVGDGADIGTAEIFEGICRHIEVNSNAEEAYDGGADFMVRIGFGAWRIVTDWIAPESEDQEIYVVPIDNPFTVYMDPTDKRDPNWCFIIQDLLADEFKHQFPESKYANGTASLSDYESIGDAPSNWATTIDGQPAVRIAEYFYVEKSKGDKGRQKKTVYWSKISGLDVLDEREWPGRYIPVVKVYGDDLIVNGDRHIAGLVRYAKDPQRAYNYWISAATERIALAPKAPWLVAEGQLEGYDKLWEASNSRNMAYLTYKPIDSAGKPAPPPQRNVVEPGIQGMTEMLQLSIQDMQSTTGLYPNNLGEKQTAGESGKAVLARQKQGDINTLNYSENLARGIRQTGCILLDLIPKVYTSARIQRIIKPDMKVGHVGIFNSKNGESESDVPEDENISRIYDIGVGRYDVAVAVGPSYQSKRQEALASQMALVQAFPQVFTIIGDKIVRNMDWPGAEEIAERLYKVLIQTNPSLADDDESGNAEGKLAQTQQQMAALAQQHQLLTQKLQEATQIIQTKQVEQQAKIQVAQMQETSKQEIVKMQEATKLAVAQITATKDANQSFADAEIERYKIMHEGAHDLSMQEHQQQHEKELAAQAAAQSQQEQASDQAHESATQASDQMHESTTQAVDQTHEMAIAAKKPKGNSNG